MGLLRNFDDSDKGFDNGFVIEPDVDRVFRLRFVLGSSVEFIEEGL